jgi:cytochrome c-type biogenesis protein
MISGILVGLWLGILTSISPCPLATNIAAISYIGKKVGNPRMVFLTGLLYALGRMLTYMAIAVLLLESLFSVPAVSNLLQEYINKFLGPVLIIAGMFLLDLLSMNFKGGGISEGVQKRVERAGIWGALVLGVIFALSFCPVSAALFFGSLIPLAVKYQSGLILPSVYGLGTGLPVLVFAVLIATGAQRVGQAYNKLVPFEKWARIITGVVFILVGIYYCLVNIFGVIR